MALPLLPCETAGAGAREVLLKETAKIVPLSVIAEFKCQACSVLSLNFCLSKLKFELMNQSESFVSPPEGPRLKLPVATEKEIMHEYQIRLYKDSDYERVREIFAHGITEHTTKAFHFSLRLPRIWAFFLVTFLLFSQITGSLLVSILAVIIDIGFIFLIHKYIYLSYVQRSLEDDMLDIQKYYLQRDGSCFWVAESSGEVAGIVAAAPPNHPGGERQVELMRMSVPRKYRGKGIAKALCRTVIDFARDRGCDAVILETSYPQVDAWKMYEKIGFRKMRTFFAPSLVTKFLCFTILTYQYDLPVHR